MNHKDRDVSIEHAAASASAVLYNIIYELSTYNFLNIPNKTFLVSTDLWNNFAKGMKLNKYSINETIKSSKK